MARPETNLTETEFKYFQDNGMGEDASSISRRIGKRLKHREEKWSTLGPEHEGQKHSTSKPEGHHEHTTTVPTTGPQSEHEYTESKADQGRTHAKTPTRPAIKIVLLGPEGAGKSALGNLLVGKEVFTTAATSESGLYRCKEESVREDGQEWEVVDTPGSSFTQVTTSKSSKMKFWSQGKSSGNIAESLKEIRDHVKQADVIIFVLNTSHKRTPDMGIKAFKQIFPPNLSETCMVVSTHGDTHYKTKGTAQLLDDIKESPEIGEFLHSIDERVVIAELGDGQPSEDAILDGNAVYGRERDQAREMVVAMVKHIMEKRHNVPGRKRHSEYEGSMAKTPLKQTNPFV